MNGMVYAKISPLYSSTHPPSPTPSSSSITPPPSQDLVLDTFIQTPMSVDDVFVVLHLGLGGEEEDDGVLPDSPYPQTPTGIGVYDGVEFEVGDTGVLVGRLDRLKHAYIHLVHCEADSEPHPSAAARTPGLGFVLDFGAYLFTLQGMTEPETHAWLAQIKYHVASALTSPPLAVASSAAVLVTSTGGGSFKDNMAAFRSAFTGAALPHAPLATAVAKVAPGASVFLGSAVAAWIAATFKTVTPDQISVLGQSMILEGIIEPVFSFSKTFQPSCIVYMLVTPPS